MIRKIFFLVKAPFYGRLSSVNFNNFLLFVGGKVSVWDEI